MSDDLPDGVQFNKKVGARQKIKGKKHHRMFNLIVNQLVYGYAPVIAVVGKEGKGKSMMALEIARVLHNEIGVCAGDFDPMNNLCYQVINFLNLLKSSERQAILFDEAGVNVSSRKWYSDMNRAIAEAIQTMRYKENVYIFILPKLKDLDKSVRERIDLRIEVTAKGVGEVTYYQYNFGKMDGESQKDRNTHFLEDYKPPMPPQGLVDRYREKEVEFKEQNLEQWIEDIQKQIEEEEQQRKDTAADFL